MTKPFRVLLSLLILIGGFTGSYAKDDTLPAPVSATISTLQSVQHLPQPSWMIKEGNIPLSIDDILKGDIKDGQILKIHPEEKVIEHFEKYWFAIEFTSEVDIHNWLLFVENTFSGFGFTNNFSEIRSYSIQDGQLARSGITGFFVPASERDFNSRHTQSLLNLSLSSGKSMTLWIHINENHTLETSFPKLSIYDPSVILPAYFLEKRDLLYFGCILMVWILSMVMFLFLKNNTDLWFFIFMTALIVDNLTAWSSDPWTSVLFPENPRYGLHFGAWTSFLMVASLLQFSRVFVNLSSRTKKLDKIMIWAILVLFFSSVILFYCVYYFEDFIFNSAFYLIFGLILLGSGITYVSLKNPLSKIIGLAILLFIIPQFIPLPFDRKFLTYLGLLLTVTAGVGYRVRLLFRERLQAEREKKDLLIQQNTLLEEQVANRTIELSNSLHDLKSTQAQLIQSEKMASLGQLTAGIAHEIQNPLNFVNNFSEVSAELVEEILDIRRKTQDGKPESEQDEILGDIKQNLEKITLHGKRADAIVKGMLEHSKTGSGKKEPTNLNALAEEFSRLSFNSFLAKNKDFKGEYKLDLDPKLPLIEVVPQDIGKVLLNILNNAFYACSTSSFEIQHSTFDISKTPIVAISTKTLGDKIEISISDNGPGIHDAIKDKIFQPFFTTKPTGQGTGLGLSLSYDIVKAHGGNLSVSSDANGSIFIFTIPIT